MVNTKNNNLVLNTPPPADPIQVALAAIQETLANIQAEVRAHSTEIANLKTGERTSQPRTDELTAQQRPHPEPNNTPYGKLIRIEFLKFSCDDVKDWVYRCKQFFKVDGVPDGRKIQVASMHMFDAALVWCKQFFKVDGVPDGRKIQVASMHMFDAVLVWYQQYVKKYPDNTPWEHFEVEVVKRFGVLYDDPIVKLKNLKQTGSVQTYQEAFEALLKRVDLPELVAVSMFMGGLKHEVRTPMRMFQATTLNETYGLARMQEATNTILKPRVHKPYRLTQREFKDKRAKGQCFYCDQKYAPGHKCSGQLHSIDVICGDDFDNDIDGDDETYQDCVGDMDVVTDSPQITLNALSGLNSYQTTRVRGIVGKQVRMMSTSVCHDLKWSLQNEVFTSDVMLLPLGGCEMVLGIPWLATLGDMQFFKDFLRKFVLVFFDDILIYNKNLEEHRDHLAQVLQVMKDNTLYAKRTKCYFAKWPIPSTLKQLRGFLGLTGYYRRFIKEYASISQPLVALTKKDAFKWNPLAKLAYHKLKEAMVKAPVLALPNFEQEFVVETDWLPKLLGYDYEIVYKKGSENVVADDLSRIDSSGEILQISVSSISSELRKELVKHFHDEAIGGHSSAHLTMKKLGSLFYWKGLKKMVKQIIIDCNVCQRQKPDLSAYPGLIQPLPIPERIWKDIFLDFIEKLPTSHGKSVILVVVDRLRKYAHFIPLTHLFTASQVAQVLLDQVYKLHGLLESIVSDRDKVFLSNFWKALFAELKVKLKLSTAYHPQTDGQTKVVNRSLGFYLRSIKVLKFHLKRSQDRMRNQANKHRADKQFKVDDWVYLKLQPHRKVSIMQGHQHKLLPKYHGPFKVAERIGEVAYRLELPSLSQIHPVFHISQLKKCHGKDHSVGVLPQLREDGLLEHKPMAY
nr:hypothetical protein [Tanacetum cinerariifolium]